MVRMESRIHWIVPVRVSGCAYGQRSPRFDIIITAHGQGIDHGLFQRGHIQPTGNGP